MGKPTVGCFRQHRIFWVALLFATLATTLLASLWGFVYESAPSGESCWVVPSWSEGTFKPDHEMYYQGLAGTDLRLAWEEDSDFNTLHTLYVTAIAASAIGLLLSVKEWQANASQGAGAQQSYAIAVMLYFVVCFIANVVIQMCFACNRCHDHNAHYALPLESVKTLEWVDISSQASRIAKAAYLTFTLVGGLFTNTLLEHVFLRKATLIGGFGGVMQCCVKSSRFLNVVLLIVNTVALPVVFGFFIYMMDDGIKVVGGTDTGEMITLIFGISIIVIVAMHVYIAVVLMIAFATLSRKFTEHRWQMIKVLICTVAIVLSTLLCYGNMAFMVANAYIVLPVDSIVKNACIVVMSVNGVSQEQSEEDGKHFCEERNDHGDVSDNRPGEQASALDVCIQVVGRRPSTHSIHSIVSVAEEVIVAVTSLASQNKYKKMSCDDEEQRELRKQLAVNPCPMEPSTPQVDAPITPQVTCSIGPSTPQVDLPMTPQISTHTPWGSSPQAMTPQMSTYTPWGTTSPAMTPQASAYTPWGSTSPENRKMHTPRQGETVMDALQQDPEPEVPCIPDNLYSKLEAMKSRPEQE